MQRDENGIEWVLCLVILSGVGEDVRGFEYMVEYIVEEGL